MGPLDQARSLANHRRQAAPGAAGGWLAASQAKSISLRLGDAGRQPKGAWCSPFWSRPLNIMPGSRSPDPASFCSILRGFIMCDKAPPGAAVVLHLRARYVSKAAILGLPG
jgi:hypothetical protein